MVVSSSATTEMGRPRSGATKSSIAVLVSTPPRGSASPSVPVTVKVTELFGAVVVRVPPTPELLPVPAYTTARLLVASHSAVPVPAVTVGPLVRVKPGGMGSVMIALVASAAPALVAVMV